MSVHPAGPPLTLSLQKLQSLLEDFQTEYLQHKSEETIGTYRRSLREFERWFTREEGRFRFTSSDVERYKRYLMQERNLHQVSVSTYLTALRRFCQYLVDRGLLRENPARQVKGNRRPEAHSREPLTQAEIDKLLEVCHADTSQLGKRDTAIIYLMLFGGLSEIEIVRADIQDLEQGFYGWFLRVQGKGHRAKDQQIPVDPPVMERIRIYLDTRRYKPTDPLFVSHGRRSEGKRLNTRSIRSRINQWLEKANIKRPGISPHSLTHTAPLIWLNDGMSIEEVNQRMRHGTLETTLIYLKKAGLLKQQPSSAPEE